MPLVLFYQTVGCRNDCLGGAVVLFQFKDLRARIYFCEIQYVVNIRSPERINALCIITHHTDVPVLLGQLEHDTVLGEVRVLILVHQDVTELRLITGKHIRMIAEKQESVEQQIIEIHCIRLPATLPVTAVNIAYGRHLGSTVAFVSLFIVGIARRRHKVILGIGNAGLHRPRFVHLFIQPHLLDDRAQQAFAVCRIINGES